MQKTSSKLTSCTIIISGLCAIVSVVYKDKTHTDLDRFVFDILAIILCIIGVIISEKKDAADTWKDYSLALLASFVITFGSVTGYTVVAHNFYNPSSTDTSLSQQKKPIGNDISSSTKSSRASLFSFTRYLIPTQPLFGISKEEVQDIQDTAVLNKTQYQNQKFTSDYQDSIINELTTQQPELRIAINHVINNNQIIENPKDQPLSPSNVTTAMQIDNGIFKTRNIFWIYLGQRFGSVWKPNNLGTTNSPKINDYIRPIVPINKRDARPLKLANGDWKLGNIIGLVKAGQDLAVVDTLIVEDENYWLLVRDDVFVIEH